MCVFHYFDCCLFILQLHVVNVIEIGVALMWGSPPSEAAFWRDIRFLLSLSVFVDSGHTKQLLDLTKTQKSHNVLLKKWWL